MEGATGSLEEFSSKIPINVPGIGESFYQGFEDFGRPWKDGGGGGGCLGGGGVCVGAAESPLNFSKNPDLGGNEGLLGKRKKV